MASCSDDLGLSSPKLNGQADLTATLVTNGGAATRLAAIDNGGAAGTEAIVFSSSDVIRVFTMDKLSQDLYEVEQLKNGGLSADFKQIENNGLTGQKYAITEADIIYGISTDGTKPTPLLTLTLPRVYKPGFTDGKQKFPIPFWGKAEEVQGTTASLNAELNGLTAFLRINAATLPAGTKYIVLTTHGSNPYQTVNPDGFMLAPFGATDITETSASAFWYKKDTDGKYVNATQITDGYSEALSGTLNAKLVEGAELKIDERLVHSDELIIDLTEAEDNNIAYVPIVCGDYKNLHVIAASYVSEKYKYCYAGTELKNFQDQTFVNNTAYYLDINLADLDDACIGEVNKYIAENCNTAGITTVINVDSLYADANPQHTTAHSTYSDTQINTNVAGNVILNINAIGVNGGSASPYGKAADNPLLICDRAVAGFESANVPQTTKEASGVFRNRFVEINVPSALYFGLDAPQYAYLQVCEASRDIYLGTVDGVKAEKVNVEIMGSNTKFGNTYTLARADRGVQYMEILPETQAAVNIRHGFDEVVIDKTAGDVYISTPSQAEEETEINKFNIKTNEATGLRLDNSLIAKLNFSDGTQAKDNRQVFTIGSSAIKEVYNNSDEYAEGNKFAAGTTEAAKTPGRVTMRSYWTGSALSARAIAACYDVATVFTVAQLASVGEGIYTEGNSNHQIATNLDPTVSSYNIPKALIRVMWLGGSKYPWIGARARVTNFSIDGENTELKNMNMLKDWNGATTYVDDPHWCCTSCWTPDASTAKINLVQDFGLIRYAVNNDQVTIKNINLNDVEIVTADNDTRAISNVGSVVGRVETKKALIEDNTVGEVKIAVKGSNVAGVAGVVTLKEGGNNLYITRNQVSGKDGHQAGYIVGASNVGGVVGQAVNGIGKTAISHNIVNLDQSILSTSTVDGNAGGIVGDLTMKAVANMNDNLVTVNETIGAAASHAAGLAANVHGTGNLVMKENAIKATDILATKDFAAGLVGELALTNADALVQDSIGLAPAKRAKTVDVSGAIKAGNQYAGGLYGKSTLDAAKKSTVNSAKVDVTTLEATNGFAGGFIGQVLQGATQVGYASYTRANASCINDVEIDNMKSRYAAGGLIGNNAQANKTPVNIITGKSNVLQADGTPYVVSTDIEVKNWEKTGDDLTDQDNYKWGTMSNIIGHMQDNLTINNDLSTVEDYAYLNVIDHLNAAAKDAVGYKKHNDEGHNIDDLNNPNKQYYWGDENGYVGVTETGTYKIGTKTVKGEQTTSLDLPANNQFRKLDTYTGTSKLTQGAN
jgi:hypothetical protein